MKLAPMASLACLAVAVGLWPASARADVVEWLYDVDVAVVATTSGEVDPRRAAGRALRELLVRMTGLKPLPNTAAVRGAIANPDRYYAQYGFVTREVQPAPEDDSGVDATETRLAGALRHLGSAGPAPLCRIADMGPRPPPGADLAGVGSPGRAARGGLRHIRRHPGKAARGSPPARPAGGIAALGSARSATCFWPTSGAVSGRAWTAASRRYDPDVLVVARVHEGREGAWTVDWRLRDPGDRASEARDLSYAADETESLRWAIDRTADELGRRLAVTGTSTDIMQLVVTGADTPPAYGAVLSYLASREYLEQVEVVGWTGTSLELALHARTDASRVRGLLSLGGMFATGDLGALSTDQPSAHMVWQGAR